MRQGGGFTLIEVLVVIGIISIAATIVIVALSDARKKARDVRRKAEIAQIGRLLSVTSCYLPDGGGGEYDLVPLVAEFKTKYPQYANRLPQTPRDPRVGSDAESYYRYIVTDDGRKCALFANLEREGESVTLTHLTIPIPGGGTGVLQSSGIGWNGSSKYFQVSN